MTVIVIGLGSMGKRRIRLLRKFDFQIKIIGIDSQKERCETARREYNVVTFNHLDEIPEGEKAFCAFIATSPLSHADLIRACLERDLHVFTELNLVDIMYEDNIRLAREKKKILFLSSTFLYRKEIMYMQKVLSECAGKVNYTYHTGQYLPDWHPWENYKNFFVGQKKTNGCRELMAIELPWIVEVFGKIKKVMVSANKMSNLDVDYADNYFMIFEHESGNKGLVAVDVVSRKPSRNLEIFGEDIFVSWNGSPEGLRRFDYDRKEDIEVRLYESVDKSDDYAASIIEDAYSGEISNFFQVIERDASPKYSFEKDKEILNLIDYIEKLSGGQIYE